MNTSKKEKYTIITPQHLTINEFYNKLKIEFNSLKDQNIIIDFSENLNIQISKIKLFLQFVC